MKSKMILPVLIAPLLIACHTTPSYSGIKLQMEYNEVGGIAKITPSEAYERVINKSKDTVILFSIDGCASCKSAYEQIEAYGKRVHTFYHYINMSLVSPTEYQLIVDMTTYLDSVYPFPKVEEAMYPMMYMFMDTGVAKVAYTQFAEYLQLYTEVVKPSN